ncbi:MAG TPA: thiamine phosphate synthase [Rhizomicrobium sp.]|jgi:thiamine-phosphate pyrophosphorylase|nr:thiamine phosphate synthase [Rhizomicrobium sp.]
MAADKLARAQLARAAMRFGHLVLVTDDARPPLAAASALPRGSWVILRSRDAAQRAQLASELRKIARARGLALLIANDGALAAKIGADGIHLSELHARDAAHWRARHPRWLITAAAHSLRACARARDADAVLLSPVFATGSHPGGATLGAIRARLIALASPVPVYALGGIGAHNVGNLSGARLSGIAAISALQSPR